MCVRVDGLFSRRGGAAVRYGMFSDTAANGRHDGTVHRRRRFSNHGLASIFLLKKFDDKLFYHIFIYFIFAAFSFFLKFKQFLSYLSRMKSDKV